MLYLLAATIFWTLTFGITKAHLVQLNPDFVAFSRNALASLLFLPFFNLHSIPNPLKLRLLALGSLYGFMYIPYTLSYQFLKAYQVGLLTLSSSIYLILLHSLASRKLFLKAWLLTLLSLSGCLILLYQKDSFHLNLKGFLLVQSSSLCFAAAQLYYRKLKSDFPSIPHAPRFAYIYPASTLTALTICLLNHNWTPISSIPTNQLAALAYLGFISTGLSFYLWNKGVTLASIPSIAIVKNIKVPLLILFSFTIFHEPINFTSLFFGSSLILLALSLLPKSNLN